MSKFFMKQYDILKKLAGNGYIFNDAQEASLSGNAALLFEAWKNKLINEFNVYDPQYVRAPLFISESALRSAGYLAHFPEQLYTAKPLRSRITGEKKQYLSPAACLHVFPQLFKTTLKHPRSSLVLARAMRYENAQHKFPFRTSGFHMLEFVMFGDRVELETVRLAIRKMLERELSSLKIPGKFTVATDAFFLEKSEGARILQKMKQLKLEFQLPVGKELIALMSINNHEEYFTDRFDIRLSKGHAASSFCVAFGLERLVAASLLLWDKKKINTFIHKYHAQIS